VRVRIIHRLSNNKIMSTFILEAFQNCQSNRCRQNGQTPKCPGWLTLWKRVTGVECWRLSWEPYLCLVHKYRVCGLLFFNLLTSRIRKCYQSAWNIGGYGGLGMWQGWRCLVHTILMGKLQRLICRPMKWVDNKIRLERCALQNTQLPEVFFTPHPMHVTSNSWHGRW
jgi:hypothetical protein